MEGSTLDFIARLQLDVASWLARSSTRYILEHYCLLHDVDVPPPSLKSGFQTFLRSTSVIPALHSLFDFPDRTGRSNGCINAYRSMRTHICPNVCIHTYVRTHTYEYIYIYTCVSSHTHIYIDIDMCICMCVSWPGTAVLIARRTFARVSCVHIYFERCVCTYTVS